MDKSVDAQSQTFEAQSDVILIGGGIMSATLAALIAEFEPTWSIRVLERLDHAAVRLIDAVAPFDTARWYLSTACVACSDDARAAIEAARLAGNAAERGPALAKADVALTNDVAFIPLATPLRWALVTPGVDLWQANARAWHPLNELRSPTT